MANGEGGATLGPSTGDASTGDAGLDGRGGHGLPPTILQASANTGVLKSGGTLSISVIATDPDGVDDLIGGVVQSISGATYASLITSAQEGTYQVDLPWDKINLTEPIEIPPGRQVSRSFVIVVFDQAGASATKTVSVLLASNIANWAVCGGEAVDPLSPQHCGACRYSCRDSFGRSYGGGVCVDNGGVFCAKGKSIFLAAADGSATCAERCGQAAGGHRRSRRIRRAALSLVPSACLTLQTAIRRALPHSRRTTE